MNMIKLTPLEASHVIDALKEVHSLDDFMDMEMIDEAIELMEAAKNTAEDEVIPICIQQEYENSDYGS